MQFLFRIGLTWVLKSTCDAPLPKKADVPIAASNTQKMMYQRHFVMVFLIVMVVCLRDGIVLGKYIDLKKKMEFNSSILSKKNKPL